MNKPWVDLPRITEVLKKQMRRKFKFDELQGIDGESLLEDIAHYHTVRKDYLPFFLRRIGLLDRIGMTADKAQIDDDKARALFDDRPSASRDV